MSELIELCFSIKSISIDETNHIEEEDFHEFA